MKHLKTLLFSMFVTAGIAQTADTTHFANGAVKSVGARNEHNKKNGEWRIYYENGQLKSLINYQNGKEHGKWETYYENGNQSSIGQFQNGIKTGEWKYYYPNGDLKTTANYSTGEMKEYLEK